MLWSSPIDDYQRGDDETVRLINANTASSRFMKYFYTIVTCVSKLLWLIAGILVLHYDKSVPYVYEKDFENFIVKMPTILVYMIVADCAMSILYFFDNLWRRIRNIERDQIGTFRRLLYSVYIFATAIYLITLGFCYPRLFGAVLTYYQYATYKELYYVLFVPINLFQYFAFLLLICCLLKSNARALGSNLAVQHISVMAGPFNISDDSVANWNNYYYNGLDIIDANTDEIAYNYHEKTCSVCLDEYAVNNKIVLLDCNHSFHTDCIKKWLQINKSCPVCRLDIDQPTLLSI